MNQNQPLAETSAPDPIPNKAAFEGELAMSPMTFREFAMILLARKRTVALAGLLGMLLVGGVGFCLKPSFTSNASFLPPESGGGMSGTAAILGQLSGLGGASSLLGGRSQGDLYVGILKSHSVADHMITRFNLMELYKVKKRSLAERHLQADSLFTIGLKDPIIKISVTSGSPERARDMANGYLDAVRDASLRLATTESAQRRLFFEQRLAQEKEELANAEVALKTTEEKSGLIAPGGQTMTQIQARAQVAAQITDREVRLAALLRSETEDNPDVIAIQSELGRLRAQLTQMQQGDRAAQPGALSTAALPAAELDYIRRQRDVKYHETLFDILAKQYEAARLDEAKDAPLQVLDWADLPDTKSGPHRTVFLAVGLLMGLVGGALRVLWATIRSS